MTHLAFSHIALKASVLHYIAVVESFLLLFIIIILTHHNIYPVTVGLFSVFLFPLYTLLFSALFLMYRLLGGKLLSNVVLVSAIQQRRPAHIVPRPPIPALYVIREPGCARRVTQQRLTSCLFYTWWCIRRSYCLHSFHVLLPPVSASPFSTPRPQFLSCRWVHQYHCAGFHAALLSLSHVQLFVTPWTASQ